ncbi:hypothetical protein OIE68_16765 [Nocardia vinacea]|uniref:hypothetical protein n=1 Tax=Nocardia vinacea TaxID=96468 RepID=UPI002E0F41DE|nr:hypothetical protein OIE68_16765 [Nocardia vinacea]
MSGQVEADEVASWVERLTAAAERGEVLDLAEEFASDSAGGAYWVPERRIPAAALRTVLINRNLAVDPHGIRIHGALITGAVDLENVKFEHPVHLTTCLIEDHVDLAGATLKELSLSGSHIRSLGLAHATITGNLFADRLTATGEINAIGATIGGQLSLRGAGLSNPDGITLNLAGATITGGLFIRDRFTAAGQIRAIGATIGGQLSLKGASLVNLNGIALNLDGVTVTGNLFADDGFTATGEVRAIGANIGELSLKGASLVNSDGVALNLDRATVTGNLFADDGFTATGEVRAIGATIGGQLLLKGASLANPGSYALSLDGAAIADSLVARDGFTATGEVRAIGAKVGGQLSLTGASLANPAGVALNLDSATIAGDLFADKLTATGEVRAIGANVGGQLALNDASLANPDGKAINLESCVITRLRLIPACVDGTVDLTRATITDLRTSSKSLPLGRLIATGWQITDVHGLIRTDRGAVTAWLKSTPAGHEFTAQPWHALAAVYDRNGHPADARRLQFTAANQTTAHAPWSTKLLRWMYLALAGHGYYPLLAALWLAGALLLGTFIADHNTEHFVPTDRTAANKAAAVQATETSTPQLQSITAAESCARYPDYPCFNAFSYALAGVVPAATGATKADWTISSTAPTALTLSIPALRILGWIFTAVLLAGVTGLLRKG